MINWKNISNLQIFRSLRFKKGATLSADVLNETYTRSAAGLMGAAGLLVSNTVGGSILLENYPSGTVVKVDTATLTIVALPADPPPGTRYTMVIGTAPAIQHTLSGTNSAGLFRGGLSTAEVTAVSDAPIPNLTTHKAINFSTSAVSGDQATAIYDGSGWIISGFVNVVAGAAFG